MTVSFSTVLSETDRRGRKGSGPGFVSAGLAVGSSPSLNAALTASFQALSARFATSALSRHVESRASASCRKPRSTDFSGDRTASRPGDLLEKGAPIAIAQITDGSAQPDQLPAAPARSTYALRHPSQAPTSPWAGPLRPCPNRRRAGRCDGQRTPQAHPPSQSRPGSDWQTHASTRHENAAWREESR